MLNQLESGSTVKSNIGGTTFTEIELDSGEIG